MRDTYHGVGTVSLAVLENFLSQLKSAIELCEIVVCNEKSALDGKPKSRVIRRPPQFRCSLVTRDGFWRGIPFCSDVSDAKR